MITVNPFNPPTPADSRGSALEETVQAASCEKLTDGAARRRKEASRKHRNSNVWQKQPKAEGLVRAFVAWCFGVAEAKFSRLGGCNLELQAICLEA